MLYSIGTQFLEVTTLLMVARLGVAAGRWRGNGPQPLTQPCASCVICSKTDNNIDGGKYDIYKAVVLSAWTEKKNRVRRLGFVNSIRLRFLRNLCFVLR